MDASRLLLALCAIFALLTLLFFARAVYCTRRGKVLRAGGSALSGIVCAVLGTAVVLIAMSYYSYGRLTGEQRVAQIQFRQTGPEEYQARLMIEGERDRLYLLRGDEWQMDARLVTWKPPVTILGLDPIYRLERLSGRYADVGRERSEARTVHDLARSPVTDIWQLARRFPALTPGIDAYYGSATYLPMADGARFDISLSRDALLARPANAPAEAALGRWDTR